MSTNEENLSYEELVLLANDPTLGNEERDAYRARLKVLFGARLREGFGAAGRQATPTARRGS